MRGHSAQMQCRLSGHQDPPKKAGNIQKKQALNICVLWLYNNALIALLLGVRKKLLTEHKVVKNVGADVGKRFFGAQRLSTCI